MEKTFQSINIINVIARENRVKGLLKRQSLEGPKRKTGNLFQEAILFFFAVFARVLFRMHRMPDAPSFPNLHLYNSFFFFCVIDAKLVFQRSLELKAKKKKECEGRINYQKKKKELVKQENKVSMPICDIQYVEDESMQGHVRSVSSCEGGNSFMTEWSSFFLQNIPTATEVFCSRTNPGRLYYQQLHQVVVVLFVKVCLFAWKDTR